MGKPILVRGARQLLTLRGPEGPRRGTDLRNLGIIQDGALLVVDGFIREVGPTRRLENLAEARYADELNASGRVVMPGFVDSHTHLVSGPARLIDYELNVAGASREEIVTAGGGLRAIAKTIQQSSAYALEAHASHVLAHCIRHGTTTVEAKSGYGVGEPGELKILRTHAALGKRYRDLVSTFLATVPNCEWGDNALDWLCDCMLRLVQRRKLATFADICCGEGHFPIDAGRRYLSAAKRLGLGLKVHAGGHLAAAAVELAIEMGATSVDHAICLGDRSIELLAASNTIATLLPGPTFYLHRAAYPAARKLIDRGAAVALATDFNPETSPTYNMQTIVVLACNHMNMTPAEAIAASTINGAYAVGLADRVGSIQPGKQADVLLLDVSDYRELPYHFGVNPVSATMKSGRVICRASEVMWVRPN